MSTPPSLRKLQYILAVARELHFRKAAEKLHVSQPNVSRQVKQCEEEFRFQILERDHHFVALTKAGRSFVADLHEILERLDNDLKKAVIRAQAIERQSPSEYVVAHSPYAPLAIRHIALELQRGFFHNLQLRYRILSTVEMLTALECDVIQAGITFAPIELAGLVCVPLGTDSWMAVVPAADRFLHAKTANVAEFSGFPVISNGAERTHPTLFRRLQEQCAARDFRFRAIAEVSSPNEAFDLVRENAGMVFLPEGVCEDLPPGIRAIRVTDLPALETVFVHRPDCPGFIPVLAERIHLGLKQMEAQAAGQRCKGASCIRLRKKK
jgi:LysR family transcriptional regulator, cyn operon transcriptional activator